jgi:hypothetical protein
MKPAESIVFAADRPLTDVRSRRGGCRLWSLWDIMNAFRCKRFALSLMNLKDFERTCHRAIEDGKAAAVVFPAMVEPVLREFDETIGMCKDSGFHAAKDSMRLGRERIKKWGDQLNISTLLNELQSAQGMLISDMWKRRFYLVDEAKTAYLDADAWFGQDVYDRFPSARTDIREAGNCLAKGCHTAAVFHLMRVVEHGLRSLGKHLGVRRLAKEKRSKVDGSVISRKYTPITYEQWEQILNHLPGRVERRLRKLRPGPVKQRWQEFYSRVLLDITAIRDAWRNHVMHARQDSGEADAEAVRVRVEAIMRTLATRVGEV